jgi:cytochrome b involved in lipid metabolism
MSARIPTPTYSNPSGYKNASHLPKPYKLRRYYTPEEVKLHCTADDCWVSFFNGVYDLTKLIADNMRDQSELCVPIAKVAGQDITHWFDLVTQEVRFSTI